jgi:hypothetical protein
MNIVNVGHNDLNGVCEAWGRPRKVTSFIKEISGFRSLSIFSVN